MENVNIPDDYRPRLLRVPPSEMLPPTLRMCRYALKGWVSEAEITFESDVFNYDPDDSEPEQVAHIINSLWRERQRFLAMRRGSPHSHAPPLS